MRKTVLDYNDKLRIADLYEHGILSQVGLAKKFNVSRRTIQRALIDMGVDPAYTQCTLPERAIIDVVRTHHLNSGELRTILTNQTDPVAELTIGELFKLLVAKIFGTAPKVEGGAHA